ncbi:inner membrane complex protein IMC3, putative [Eimeria maxima]|uniref:Inner membrane complex protein IMC3, putative n=1 Tax=Eimeria maxima TaxID=5804 RepID=U6M7Z8_EIMMA|nr:inner membrane complex protein IMC3, putative [Eimeria maxima]CDJ60146.1 inner membrane complex protein IMC3, putative [Eimeria maxima]
MSKKEDVTTPEEGVDVLVQPLPHPSRPTEPAPFATREPGAYPGAPVSATMPPPHEASAAEMTEGERESSTGTAAGAAAAGGAGAALHSTVPCSMGPASRPPPQVMTALGPMPLPPEIRRRIPEKFVARPIIEEREIYIAKKEVQERTIEVPHVHYEHKFAEVAKSLKIKKIVPTITEVIKEVPREVYKPVVEEKVIEVPQGVKYVEVPVEVPCLYPPKIVPRPKVQVVERVVETVKPVVQEKIIEVPQTVVKQIPKIKTVEVPYYVPRYVEKIIEVPYQPPDAASLPPILSGTLPSGIAAKMPLPFQMGPVPLSQMNGLNLPYEAKIDVRISQQPPGQEQQQQGEQGGQGGQGQQQLQQQNTSCTLTNPGGAPAIELVQGFRWGKPPNAPPVIEAPCGGTGAAGPDGDPRMRYMPPLMVTCPPEVGQVNFAGFVAEPDILTRDGVMAYSGFRAHGNFKMLFPPLAPQPGVPMNPAGTPDVRTIAETQSYISGQQHIDALQQKATEIEQEYENPTTNWCGQAPPPTAGTVYEQ